VVVLSLYTFGGAVIHDFAFTILIGVLVGTYSSIFVASPMLLYLGKKPKQVQTKETKGRKKAEALAPAKA
jgi:preprotein translocase subunit SecF